MTAVPTQPSIPREVWVLVAAGFVIAVGFGVVAPALPQFAHSFDVGVTASSAIVSAFAVMRLLFAPPAGHIVRALGERRVYLIGLLIVALSTLAAAFAQSYWQLLLFRGLGGVGSVMFSISAAALMIQLVPPAIRGRVSGVYSSSFVLGNVCGPLIGGALVGFGLRVPFIVYSVALLIAAAVVGTQLRRRQDTGTDDAVETRPEMTVRQAIRIPAYRAGLLGGFTFGWMFALRVSIVPLFFALQLHQPTGIAGLALAAYAAGDAVAMIPAGRLADRIGRRPVIITGFLVLAAATAALALSDAMPVAFVTTFFGGIGTGMVSPAQQAVLADLTYGTARNGPVIAMYQMMQDLGTISGPLIGGVLVGVLGFHGAFWVTCGLALVAVAGWVSTAETRAARDAESR